MAKSIRRRVAGTRKGQLVVEEVKFRFPNAKRVDWSVEKPTLGRHDKSDDAALDRIC